MIQEQGIAGVKEYVDKTAFSDDKQHSRDYENFLTLHEIVGTNIASQDAMIEEQSQIVATAKEFHRQGKECIDEIDNRKMELRKHDFGDHSNFPLTRAEVDLIFARLDLSL